MQKKEISFCTNTFTFVKSTFTMFRSVSRPQVLDRLPPHYFDHSFESYWISYHSSSFERSFRNTTIVAATLSVLPISSAYRHNAFAARVHKSIIRRVLVAVCEEDGKTIKSERIGKLKWSS